MKTRPFFISAILFFALNSQVQAASLDPLEVVQKATNGMTEELKTHKKGKLTEAILSQLVKKHIQPAIDQRKIAMGAMGKYWRRATPKQQALFIESFKALQIRTYTSAFASFSEGEFVYGKIRYNSEKTRAIVKTLLKIPHQKDIPFDFKLYYNQKQNTWLIYSAAVAGLDLVKTYRDQVQSRLQTISMDALLEELKAD